MVIEDKIQSVSESSKKGAFQPGHNSLMENDIKNMDVKELKEYSKHLKERIKAYSKVNVVKPLFYKDTKQDFLKDLYSEKKRVKNEIKKRKRQK